jgi:sugar lactone lactonase YvrE
MAEQAVRLFCDAAVAIGESPVWLDDRVYWTDPVARQLLSVARQSE